MCRGIGLGISFFQVGFAFTDIGPGPGINLRSGLELAEFNTELPRRGARIGPDSKLYREVATDRGRLQLYLDDVCLLINIVV